jgi:hypothetical protein
MSFLAPKTDISEPSATRQSYEASGPVPVVFGRQRIPLKLIESPFNHAPADHGDKQPKGNMYSVIAAGCHGPVDWCRLWLNGAPIWRALVTDPEAPWQDRNKEYGLEATRQAGQYYVDLDYRTWRGPGGSWCRIYWGLPDQPPDPFLTGTPYYRNVFGTKQPPRNPDGSPRIHPPYSGIFYVVFWELHFDEGKPSISGSNSLPVIEAEVMVRPPGDTGSGGTDVGVNPIPAAREILANPVWGADLKDDAIPAAAWAAAAARMDSDRYDNLPPNYQCISPLLDSRRDLAAVMADLLGYFDGFLRLAGGGLIPDWYPNQSTAAQDLTVLTRHDLLREPDIDPQTWDDTLSEVSVHGRNAYDMWGEDSVVERSPQRLSIYPEANRKTVQAPWIINPWQRRAYARRVMARFATPGWSSRLEVMPARAINPDGSLLMPGDLCRFNYEPMQLLLLCRVIERSDLRDKVDLTVEVERNAGPLPWLPEEDERELPLIEPADQIAVWRLFELPDELAGGAWPPRVAILAARPNRSILAAAVYFSGTGAWVGEEMEMDRLEVFAMPATLQGAITAGQSAGIVFGDLDPADLPGELNRTYNDEEAAAGRLLAVVGDEILAFGAIDGEASTADSRTYTMHRGMFGTAATTHSDSTPCWILTLADLLRASAGKLPERSVTVSTSLKYRLASITGWALGDFGTTVSLTLRTRSPAAPLDLDATWDEDNESVVLSWEDPPTATHIEILILYKGSTYRSIAVERAGVESWSMPASRSRTYAYRLRGLIPAIGAVGDHAADSITTPGWAAPTLLLESDYSDVVPASQDQITYTIPEGLRSSTTQVQIWDNLDLQGAEVERMIHMVYPDQTGTATIALAANYVAGITPGETFPLIACRYLADGQWSQWAIINWTAPNNSGSYSWTSTL